MRFLVDCGLLNLATCLPRLFFEFLVSLLNAPIEPLVGFIKALLSEPVYLMAFYPLWAIITYLLSLFYGLFFLFAGFNLMISGHNMVQRENAKEWLRNVVLMVLFVQASFMMYSLIVELSSLLSSGMLGLIDPNFFLISPDNLASLSFQFVTSLPYTGILVVTAIILSFRYLFISLGVVFFPIGLFFYFIPPLRPYGQMILNVLLVSNFVSFFCALVLFGSSLLVQSPLFHSFNIMIAMVAFLAVDVLILFLAIFAVLKAAFSVVDTQFVGNAKRAARYLL